MKKIIYILLLLMPAALIASDARVERWNSRIERITKYRDEVAKIPGFDSSAVKLFNDEIKSAGEFISVLTKYSSGDGSVKAETKKYTVDEIEAYTAEIAAPVISVHYAAEMIRSGGNPVIKSAVKDDINRHAVAKGLPSFKKESRESEILASRYIFQKYFSGYENSKQKAVTEILGITEYELSRTGYNSNRIDLCGIIMKAAEKVSSSDLNVETGFNETHLTSLPEWKEHERAAAALGLRINASVSFAESHGTAVTPDDRGRGISHIENITFLPARSTIIMMCENTEKSPSTGYNNPVYEIPDFKGIITAVEDIDRYRKSLSASISGSEGTGFINKVKSNNRGIAERYLKQYENLFKREKLRIAGLKSRGGNIIVYNEEIFNASEKHFGEIKEKLLAYADLSTDYTEAVHSSSKIDPELYLAQYSSKTGRNLEYISFIERLTADAASAGKTADIRINNLFRGSSKELFAMMKSLYTAEAIPADVRNTMTREHIKIHAGINENLRIKGTALALSSRKNYEAFTAAYSESVSSKKNGIIASERSIGQDEVDRLMSCAEKFSKSAASLSYTSQALKNYADEYRKITDDIRDGNDLSQYLEKINSGSIIPLVKDFSPEKIDSEMKLREMLAREGNESLSGAVALMQYYNRRGFTLKYNYTAEDIKQVKDRFSDTPETAVASWKMNGRNYRLVDANSTENLKRMINRKAWHPETGGDSKALKERFSADGKLSFSISLPGGWKRAVRDDDSEASISLSLQSPDLLGKIILRAVKFDSENIQVFSDELNRSGGFTPVAREWGKLGGTDYLMAVSKNRYDAVMESYIVRKGGFVIQVSGIADKKKHGVMSKSLKDIFSSLEI